MIFPSEREDCFVDVSPVCTGKIILNMGGKKKIVCSSNNKEFEKVFCSLIEVFHLGKRQCFKWSVDQGHLEILKYLVAGGMDINSDDSYALQYSAGFGHFEMVKWVVENGASYEKGVLNYAISLASPYKMIWEYLKGLL